MTDLDFKELAPDRYDGTVEKIRYSLKQATTKIIVTYQIHTPHGVRRLVERILIAAPPAFAAYFHTTQGLARIEDILRIKGLTLADAQAAGGLMALPPMLEGVGLKVVTRNQRIAGFNVPSVMRVEKP